MADSTNAKTPSYMRDHSRMTINADIEFGKDLSVLPNLK